MAVVIFTPENVMAWKWNSLKFPEKSSNKKPTLQVRFHTYSKKKEELL